MLRKPTGSISQPNAFLLKFGFEAPGTRTDFTHDDLLITGRSRDHWHQDAVAGDIIGIHNHGLEMAEAANRRRNARFQGHSLLRRNSSAWRACATRSRANSCKKACRNLARKARSRYPASGALLLGAVGTPQFEVVAQRLQTEYKVDAMFEPADIHTARWLIFSDETTRKNFEREQHRMAKDVDGNLVYLASTRYNLTSPAKNGPVSASTLRANTGEAVNAFGSGGHRRRKNEKKGGRGKTFS